MNVSLILCLLIVHVATYVTGLPLRGRGAAVGRKVLVRLDSKPVEVSDGKKNDVLVEAVTLKASDGKQDHLSVEVSGEDGHSVGQTNISVVQTTISNLNAGTSLEQVDVPFPGMTEIICLSSVIGCGRLFYDIVTKYVTDIRHDRSMLLPLVVSYVIIAFGNGIGTVTARYRFLYGQDKDSCSLGRWHDICILQSFLTTTSAFCSFGLVLTIVTYYRKTLHKDREPKTEESDEDKKARKEVGVYAYPRIGLSVIVPVIIVFVAGAFGALGEGVPYTPGWCWISPDLSYWMRNFWMFMTGKLWEILTYIFLLVHFFEMRKDLTALIGKKEKNPAAYALYVFVPFIVFERAIGTMKFILHMFFPTLPYWLHAILAFIQGVGDSGQGLTLWFVLLGKKDIYKLLGRKTKEQPATGPNYPHTTMKQSMDHVRTCVL